MTHSSCIEWEAALYYLKNIKNVYYLPREICIKPEIINFIAFIFHLCTY